MPVRSIKPGSFDALAFSVFDRNGDGSLNSEEYGSLVGALGDSGGRDIGNFVFTRIRPDPENFTFSSVDKNEDGKIGLDEFEARTRDVRYTLGSQVLSINGSGSLPTRQAMTRLIFEVYDKNDDGKLSAAEEAVFERDFGVDLPPERGTGSPFVQHLREWALPNGMSPPAADRTAAAFDTALQWAADTDTAGGLSSIMSQLWAGTSDIDNDSEPNPEEMERFQSSVMPQLWARMSDIDEDSTLNPGEMERFQRIVGNHVNQKDRFLFRYLSYFVEPSIIGMAREAWQRSGD